jgi:hypothetical protein
MFIPLVDDERVVHIDADTVVSDGGEAIFAARYVNVTRPADGELVGVDVGVG